VPNIMSLGICF